MYYHLMKLLFHLKLDQILLRILGAITLGLQKQLNMAP